MKFSLLIFLSGSFCLATLPATSQNVQLGKKVKQALAAVDTNLIKRDIAYLADDKLKGRLPGEAGYQAAVEYIIDQFKQTGLLPAGENGLYTQKLILRKATINNSSAIAVLKDKSGNVDSLTVGRDILIMPDAVRQTLKADGDLAFAGFGVEVAGKYSDYHGLDVSGKIVVVLAGTPPGLTMPSTLLAHFTNLGTKLNIATSKGAIGLLLVQSNLPLSGGTTITVAMNPEKTIAYSRNANEKILAVGRIQDALLQRLFMNSGKSLSETMKSLAGSKPASFVLNTSLSVQYSNSFTDIESYNVVGKIEGGDPTLKNEYVVHTAHLDHVGVGKVVNGDSIYNGAHDNASGVASLLEIARTYKRSGSKPRRSVLIIMVTAEEMGLLGSMYFAGHPTVAKEQIVADLNTDMPTLIFPLLSIAPLGAAHSSLANNVAFAAKELDIEIQEDPMPEEVRFIRSDQYSFVLQGIPALHVKYGTKGPGPDIDIVKLTKEWRDKNYHKPSDEITNGFDYGAARKYVQLNFLISYSVAQTSARPTWNPGDFFEVSAKKKTF